MRRFTGLKIRETKVRKISVSFAEELLKRFESISQNTSHERAISAFAHLALSDKQEVSTHRRKLHTNTAITLLQNIDHHVPYWRSSLSLAYFKRAEISENEFAFLNAARDYHRVVELLNTLHLDTDTKDMLSKDRLVLAQSAIALADMILHNEIERDKLDLNHPLFYVNKALEQLILLDENTDEAWVTLAYAHYLAGLTLSQTPIDSDLQDAKIAFNCGLQVVFKLKPALACPLLKLIYAHMGIMYEEKFNVASSIQETSSLYLEYANLYYNLAELFFLENKLGSEELQYEMEEVVGWIHRALDPYPEPLETPVIIHLIDGLIYLYYCWHESLKDGGMFAAFVEHVLWLIIEVHQRTFELPLLLETTETIEQNRIIHIDPEFIGKVCDDPTPVISFKVRAASQTLLHLTP